MGETITVHLSLEPEDVDALRRLHGLLTIPSFRDGLLTDMAQTVHRKMACDVGGNWKVEAALEASGGVQAVEVAACPHGENPLFCVYCHLECGD
jgi:hypothetical protein